MEAGTHEAPSEPPSCCFCALEGFRVVVPIAMLSLARDGELRRARPELHARLGVSDGHPRHGTTDDGLACTHSDVVTLFVSGVADGVSADACRRNRLFCAGTTYFLMPSRRLSSLTTDAALTYCGLSADGGTLATVEHGKFQAWNNRQCADATVTVRSGATGGTLLAFKSEGAVDSAALSADGTTLVTVEHAAANCHSVRRPESDATVTVREVATGAQLRVFKSERPVTISGLSADGKTLLTVEHSVDDGRLDFRYAAVIRHAETGAQLQKFVGASTGTQQIRVSAACLSGDGKTAAYVQLGLYRGGGGQKNTVFCRSVATGAPIKTFEHADSVTAVWLSADGSTILVLEDQRAIVRAVSTGVTLQEFAAGTAANQQDGLSRTRLTSACLSEDGEAFVMAEAKYQLEKWTVRVIARSVSTGVTLAVFEHAHKITSVRLSADGKTLLTAENENMRRYSSPCKGRVIVRDLASAAAQLRATRLRQEVLEQSDTPAACLAREAAEVPETPEPS
jgi:dipeptidyl aminopeptidase/acylaminoacyl peptidase